MTFLPELPKLSALNGGPELTHGADHASELAGRHVRIGVQPLSSCGIGELTGHDESGTVERGLQMPPGIFAGTQKVKHDYIRCVLADQVKGVADPVRDTYPKQLRLQCIGEPAPDHGIVRDDQNDALTHNCHAHSCVRLCSLIRADNPDANRVPELTMCNGAPKRSITSTRTPRKSGQVPEPQVRPRCRRRRRWAYG